MRLQTVLIDAALLYRWTMDMCVSCVKTLRTEHAAASKSDESKIPVGIYDN